MRTIIEVLQARLYQPHIYHVLRFLLIIGLMMLCNHALASNLALGGNDYLDGTDANAWSTFSKTGKSFLFIIEAVVAAATYVKTRNLMAFTGVIAICVFIDIILHMAGK